MKNCTSILFYFLFVSYGVQSQVLTVKDPNGNPIPYFTLSHVDANKVWVGNHEGMLFLDDLGISGCGFEIRHIGNISQEFCLEPSTSKGKSILRVLEENIIQLDEVDVPKPADKKILEEAFKNLRATMDIFSFMKGQYVEIEGDKVFHSFGFLNYYTPIDRTTRKNRFYEGNFSFIYDKSRLINFEESEIPFNSYFPYLTEAVNDVLYDLLNSNGKGFEAISNKVIRNINWIVFAHEEKDVKLVISGEGQLREIRANLPEMKSHNGKTIAVEALAINFLQYKGKMYFNEVSTKFMEGKNQRESYLILHSFPDKADQPGYLKKPKDHQGYFGAISAQSRNPDISSEKNFFASQSNGFYTKQMVKTFDLEPFGEQSEIQYVYHEKAESFDEPSAAWVRRNHKFIVELLQALQDFGLSW